MYAICSVVKNDVLKAVKEMVKKGYNFPVIQVSKKQYKDLEQNQEQIPEVGRSVTEKGFPHAINLKTRVLHKVGCPYHRGAKYITSASIVSKPSTTGLRICRHCFK